MFLPTEICANKLVPHSELMIFIRYEDNEYCFMWHTQGNTIFHSTHAIFNKGLFPKYTNSHAKEHKLYNELLDKTCPEIESLVSNFSKKDRPAPVPISHISIPPTHSPSPPLSYKSTFPLLTSESQKPIVEIGETNNVDSDVEMQLPSPQ